MDTLIETLQILVLTVVVSLTLFSPAQAATYQTYVIHTYGGSALLPAVRQQLNASHDGGTVATYQDKLVLNTTPTNYKAVQQLLTQIDGQPQALMVSIKVSNNSSAQSNINQGRVIISNRGIQGAGIINQSNNQQQNNSLYQVQTLSGSAASISTGTLWSLTQNYNDNYYSSYNRPSGQIIIQQQILLPTTQGIQVKPRLLPNGQVEVNLAQVEEKLVSANSSYNQNSPNRNGYSNNAINRQSLNSTIIVSRGQWVNIGQILQNAQNQSSNYGGNSTSSANNSTPIWLLVQ
ncbi:type II and III secretion system protein [Psychrobacter frigidicola]|uniref:Type II and III secretion system protein n=1 Tax=Psychrobacter frigidicola TaxID=45611 RepID=A0A5C7A7S4_9GAMM|nr:type II and III secretion system protein [Psychrobacter frigidicola]TXD96800.1 type II and III secretion system protein [Psychrobacter frigidicola]